MNAHVCPGLHVHVHTHLSGLAVDMLVRAYEGVVDKGTTGQSAAVRAFGWWWGGSTHGGAIADWAGWADLWGWGRDADWWGWHVCVFCACAYVLQRALR